jgi:ABC-type multidrug transport system fused ATPase/permease subunit
MIPITLIVYVLHKSFHNTAVQCKRLESAALSPIYQLFGSMLKGSTSIRVFGLEDWFIIRFRGLLDTYQQAKIMNAYVERRFASWLNVICAVYTGILAFGVVCFRSHLDTDLGVLAITYSTRMVGFLQLMIRLFTMLTQAMTSVERLQELNGIPQDLVLYTPEKQRQTMLKQTPAL